MGQIKKTENNNNMPPTSGYTIIETLIFLAISSLFAISAMALVSGRQRSAEFTEAVNDFEAQLRDIANDVTTGYFPNPGNILCTASPATNTAPSLSTNAVTQPPGTNSDCIYVGRVLQFDSSGAYVYTSIGRRQSNNADVSDVLTARPKLLAKTSATDTTTPESIERLAISSAIQVAYVRSTNNNGVTNNSAGVAFFTTFGKTSSISSSASINADIIPVNTGMALTADQYSFVMGANNFYSELLPSQAVNQAVYTDAANTVSGVSVCVNGLGVSRHAIITMGAQRANGSATSVEIRNGVCA